MQRHNIDAMSFEHCGFVSMGFHVTYWGTLSLCKILALGHWSIFGPTSLQCHVVDVCPQHTTLKPRLYRRQCNVTLVIRDCFSNSGLLEWVSMFRIEVYCLHTLFLHWESGPWNIEISLYQCRCNITLSTFVDRFSDIVC